MSGARPLRWAEPPARTGAGRTNPRRFAPAARPPAAAVAGGWLHALSIATLTLTLLYVIFGIPGDDPTDTSKTDKSNPLNSVIWLVLLVMAGPVFRKHAREVMRLLLANKLLLVLLAYFTLSVAWALDPSASFRRLAFTFVQVGLFSTLIVGIRRPPSLHLVIAIVCSVAAVADLASWVISPATAMTDEGFAGLQGQKNQTGLMLMYGILAAFPCIFLVRGWLWKAMLAGATLLMLALLVATRSTTSQSVVIGAAVVMPALLTVAKLPARHIKVIAAAAVAGLATAVFVYLAYCAATGDDPMLPLRGATFTARTDIWSFVTEEIGKRPWLGAGYSSFWGIDPAVQPSLKSDEWFAVDVIITEAHNGYLDLLATNGIVGLVLGLAVVFRTIGMAGRAIVSTSPARQAWRSFRMAKLTAGFHMALLLGLLLHNMTESNLFANNGLLAVAFLLCTFDLEKWRLSVAPEATRALR